MQKSWKTDDFYDKPDYSRGDTIATERSRNACLCNITRTSSYKSLFLSVSPALPDRALLQQGMTVYFWRQNESFYISFGKEPRLVDFYTRKLQVLTQTTGYTNYRVTLPITFVKKYFITHENCFTLTRETEGVYNARISIQARYQAYRPDSAETGDH